MDSETPPLFRPTQDGFRWDGVAHLPYKQDGSAPFKDISRQVLFHEDSLGCELRYFEMDAAGYSTLERHEHMHAVMILRGHGECLLGEEVRDREAARPCYDPGLDLASVPGHRAASRLGFLCMVNVQRDRPQLPTDAELGGDETKQPRGRALPQRCDRRTAGHTSHANTLLC